MIDLKKYNFFTGEVNAVARGVSDMVKFFDLAGKNYILLTPEKPKSSGKMYDLCLYHHLENKLEFNTFDNFVEQISNKSNLFRIDLLVFDFWSIQKNNLWKFISEIENINIPSIIVSKEYSYKSTDDVNDFLIRQEYKDLTKSDIWLNDKITNSSATIDSLKTSYIRDKKLENLFGDNQ